MLRQHLEQRRRVLLTVEEIVIEELHGIDAQMRGQVVQVLIEPRGGGQGCLAAEHRRHAAESAAESAAQSGLIAGGAAAEKGSCQIVSRVSGALIGQRSCQTGGGKGAILVVNDLISRAPRQTRN